jgi:asparagine synthase (glutamine-hydrolysing)
MVSACGRYVISYNGEVYNFLELRQRLNSEGVAFRGASDTEVIIEACAAWGMKRAVAEMIGMFAFAIWDKQTRRLTLVRDRLGIKPLYWGRSNGVIFFGSQPSAFFPHPDWHPEVDRSVLRSYLRHAYIPAPHSIYSGLGKLQPGHMVEIQSDGTASDSCYWSLQDRATQGTGNRIDVSDEEAVDQLDTLLRDATAKRMISDVPLGAFLSGGIDSSTIVALMQAQSDRPVRSFSIGFNADGYDEATHAKAVAQHLGTDHTELYIEPRDAMAVLPNLADWYDEPFADSSQIPTFLVSKMTRDHVTVALTGDGGDELFAGYNRYFWADRLWQRAGRFPKPARGLAASAIECLAPTSWDRLFAVLPDRVRPPHPGNNLHKLAEILRIDNQSQLYLRLVSQWNDPSELVRDEDELRGVLWDQSLITAFPDFTERMQFLDGITYLPDDILAKVDRASMAVSLEARVPMLDHRVVDFAWRLPKSMKIRNNQGKWILRRVLDKYVPNALIDRPKMGFGVPIDQWLRGDLRDWAENLLSEKRLREDGFFDPKPIRDRWTEHLSGKKSSAYALWTILMFQAWHDRWIGSA